MWTGKGLIKKKKNYGYSLKNGGLLGLKGAGRHISEAHLALLACFERLISQITSHPTSA